MPAPPPLDAREDADEFHLVPESAIGKIGAVTAVAALLIFVFAVIAAGWKWPPASAVAVGAMIAVILGGLMRVYTR
jgi:hypothetical protein